MAKADPLPDGFTVRPPTVEDAAGIAALINGVTLAEAGVPWTTVEETRDELGGPDPDPGLAPLLVLAPDGEVAGLLQFWVSEPPVSSMQVFVASRLWGRGLSAWLIRRGEAQIERRAAKSGATALAHVSRFGGNDAAARLFGSLGYAYVRTFWMMRIELDRLDVVQAEVPEGIVIRTFERGRDEVAVHAALAEAFADHWGAPFDAFERWVHRYIEGEGARFDPTLWFLATEGDEVAGAACCTASTPRSEDTAEVGYLAVRRPWRRRGVGLALLRTAFAELGRRGIPRCELGVDAENPTGATRLYERAGMHQVYHWEVWEKELGDHRRGAR